VGTDGALRHQFTFRVTSWPRRVLPLRLPAGSSPVAVRVDGRWLPQPDFVAEGEDAGLLRVPVPERGEEAEDGGHHFEVVYGGGVPAWALWARVEAPAPSLPVPPITFRRSWRLPPGVRPLGDWRQRRVPGPGEGFGPADGVHRPADLFRLAGSSAPPWAAPAGASERRQALADAAVSLRSGRAGQEMTLKELVDQVALGYLKGHAPLVVDATALREAGVGPETRLTVRPPAGPDDRALPWEERGLVTLFARPTVLLTTRRQCERWRVSGAVPSSSDQRGSWPGNGLWHGDGWWHGRERRSAGRWRGCWPRPRPTGATPPAGSARRSTGGRM
jgi:hypothetical protein